MEHRSLPGTPERGDFLIMFTYTVASHKILAIIKTFKKRFVKKKISAK